MSEDIRVMTAQLAADPTSLVFLPLGEALRQRGQLDAAEKVAVAGLSRYPDLADGHDLLARIVGDRGDFEQAFDEWGIALRLDPKHVGAHKGIGFLYFVAGDLEEALHHLETAGAALPDDDGLQSAIARVHESLASRAQPEEDVPAGAPPVQDPAPAEPVDMEGAFRGMEGAEDGLLLLDNKGRCLTGGLLSPEGVDVADVVAAHLAGVAQEASRAVELLGLGAWHGLTVQAPGANLQIVAPDAESVLLLAREAGMPLGRLAMLSERAAAAAREWLQGLS